ncbi:MAG: hypothetical protein KatS3mg113_1019 [Planctomycetaceae bacterium]|nr:MAG: hypothetical protein KatS3mg113_1019 [Planctomycetaceae bacterium]
MVTWKQGLLTQALLGICWLSAWLGTPERDRPIPAAWRKAGFQHSEVLPQPATTTPYNITPLYDDVSVVSDEELAQVLQRILPRFPREKLRPNVVEHALRTWGAKIDFEDSELLSGPEMVRFLTDHASYITSWGQQIEPLLQDRQPGVTVRWGREECASVHHDHLLACLTEAGLPLDTPVYTPKQRTRLAAILQQAIYDFHVDEAEVEWSSLAFTLWQIPQPWRNDQRRELSFDLLAERLMRGDRKLGTCSGTHRVYTLIVLWRLNEQRPLLSAEMKTRVWEHLRGVQQAILASQFPEGYWPSNWPEGEAAIRLPVNEELYRRVIATGHHLEWLALAPEELQLPRERIRRAARWLVETTTRQPGRILRDQYTFFSHVGNALCLWRRTRPADFWKRWCATHPPAEQPVNALDAL